MSELNILFAINKAANRNVEDAILNKYVQNYDKKFNYDKAYYLLDIMKSLNEKKYEILILSETLEPDFDPSFIDKLTDKYSDVRVILRMEDKRRGTAYVKKLFAMGSYDCIFQEDFNLENIVDLIENPRNKKSAKEYYGIDDNVLEGIEETLANNNLMKIPDNELEQVLISLNNATSDNIKELFDIAKKTYNFQQITYLISILSCNEDKKVINLLKENDCDISKYEAALEEEVSRVEKGTGKTKEKEVTKVIEKIVEKVVEVEKPVEKIVEKPVIQKEYVDREVIKEVFKTPNDYKKVVAIIGSDRRVGTTTMIELMAKAFTDDNRKVAILDFSKNQNLFERHIFNEEEKSEPLIDLIKGYDKAFKLNNNCSLYTSAPKEGQSILTSSEMNRAIDITKIENDIVIIDLELEDLEKVYPLLDKIIVVISQDLTTTKYFTNTLFNITNNLYLSNLGNKLQFVINKNITGSRLLSNKDIVECYLYKVKDYMNTELNTKIFDNELPILKVNFDLDILLSSYRGDRVFTVEDEETEEDIRNVCNAVYPISQKRERKKGFLSAFLKGKKNK